MDSSGRILPADLDDIIFGYCPWEALNGFARTCKSWSAKVRHADIDRFVTKVNFQDEASKIGVCRLPNKTRHGMMTFSHFSLHYYIKYERGQPITWRCEDYILGGVIKTSGLVGSNIYISVRRGLIVTSTEIGIRFVNHDILLTHINESTVTARLLTSALKDVDRIKINVRPCPPIDDVALTDQWARNVVGTLVKSTDWMTIVGKPIIGFRMPGLHVLNLMKKYMPEVFQYAGYTTPCPRAGCERA